MDDDSFCENKITIKFRSKENGGYKRFEIESTYLKSDIEELFHNFCFDIIRRLSEGRVVNYDVGYWQLKPMKRKLFSGKWLPAVFGESGHIDSLHKYLVDNNYDNGWYADLEIVYEKKNRKETYKSFSLVQNRLDMDLFQKFMMTDHYESRPYSDQIYITPISEVDIMRFTTSEEIVSYYSQMDSLFQIVSHHPYPIIHIDMNTKYFSAEQLIEIIKDVAEKYKFTLETEG